MKKYFVPVQFVFDGYAQIEADNEDQAKQIVKENIHLVLGQPLEVNDNDKIIDWGIDIHPAKIIEKTVSEITD